MGAIFLFLFFMWLFKGFGKAMKHSEVLASSLMGIFIECTFYLCLGDKIPAGKLNSQYAHQDVKPRSSTEGTWYVTSAQIVQA